MFLTIEIEDQASGDGSSEQAVIGKLRENGGIALGLGSKHYFWMEWDGIKEKASKVTTRCLCSASGRMLLPSTPMEANWGGKE